jgi:hypothetical protein
MHLWENGLNGKSAIRGEIDIKIVLNLFKIKQLKNAKK